MSGTDGYRYPGPNEFEDTPADHLLFSGRSDEITAITQQVVSSRLLVLYGSSGLGKSSLLKAGVYPKLRENQFCPVRVRITDRMAILQLLTESCAEAGREAGLDYTPGVGSTPWEFFKTAMFWRGETLLYPVLVFDQFEELFTNVRSEWKRNFANEIGPLASGNLPDTVRYRLEQSEQGLTDLAPQVKLIFSLREEFYGSLEELSSDFPALFQDRFRLLPMNRSRAELAIRQPALRQSEGNITFNTPTFTYADETIKIMLDFLSGRHGRIEPFQLQLLCQHVERVIVPGKFRDARQGIEITPSDLGGERMMSDLVRRFYTDSLAQLPTLQGRRARELCDTGLLSSDGHRLMLEKNEILRNYNISEDTLGHLIDRRILREEPRLDSLFYEIGHDTIAHSILKTRRLRLPRKYRVPAAVVVSLIVIFTLYAVFTNFRLRSERDREKVASLNAQQAQGKAEDARTKAEKLASYLIGEDLMDAIKPIGRLEVLESVEKQIDGYLASLKSNQEGETSDLAIQIDGLSHLNRGDLDYMQGGLSQADGEYRLAQTSFHQLMQRNVRNAEWLHNLADAEAKIATVAGDRLYLQQSLQLYQQALNHIQAALPATRPGIDGKLRDKLLRDEADALQNIGQILYQQRQLKDALAKFNQSVDIAKGQAHTMQWTYILEDGLIGKGIVLDTQGQQKDAEEALQGALEIAKSSARTNPFDPEAQRRLGLAENRLANFNIYRRDPEQVLGQYKSLNNIMQEAIAWEPKNQRWQRDFAYTFLLLGEGNNYAKRPAIGEQLLQQAIPRFEQIQLIDKSNASLTSDLADAHRDWGDFIAGGQPEIALQHYKEALRLISDLRKLDITNADLRMSSVNILFVQADSFLHNKQPDEALAACKQAIQILSTLEPVDPTNTEYWELVGLLHREMGDALREKKDNKAANLEYQTSLHAFDEAIQRAPASSRYWNDRFLLRFDHMAKTEENAERKLKIDQDAFADARKAAELDPDTAFYYFNQGVVQSYLGDSFLSRNEADHALVNYTGAEQSYRKAIELAGKQDANDYRDWLYLLLEGKIAGLLAKKDNKQEELLALEKAIQIRKDQAATDPHNNTYLTNLASAQTAVADGLGANNEPAAAFSYYTDAEQTYRKAIESADKASADNYRTYLVLLFCKHVAPLREKQHDEQGARQAYEAAIQIRQDAVAAAPKNATYRGNLADSYRDVGDALMEHDHLEDANAFYQHAVETERDAIKLEPSAAAWDELAGLFYNSLATLSQKQHKDDAAIEYFRQAAETEVHAVALDPGNAVYPSNIGFAHQALGNSLLAQRDTAKAEQEYAQSEQYFKKAILLKNNDSSYWYGLSLTLDGMAQIHQGTGDMATAKRYYDEAREAAVKAGDLNPKEQQYADERVSLENKLRQLVPQ